MSKLPFDQFLVQALKRNKVKQAHPDVLARGIEMVRRCYDEGIYILFTDGLRTDIDQAKLFGQNRNNYWYKSVNYSAPNKPWATNAEPGTSFHNFGLALDFVLTDGTAKPVFWTRNKQWERAAAIAKELGFDWGGDWPAKIRDNPHIEYKGSLTIQQVRAGRFPTFKPYKKTEGGLTMDQYNELKKLIEAQAKTINIQAEAIQELTAFKKGYLEEREPSKTHADAWGWAQKEGLVDGKNPQRPLTREQFATIEHRKACK
ncbi:M15 family metallopeptidase [Lysinibacillus sp. UGB7]|uniref:M15 family metallopeptidase n=1 Tax=Lysinibacillus sp. UGB7 TaxID=3411039 RepID=UPI003B806EA5